MSAVALAKADFLLTRSLLPQVLYCPYMPKPKQPLHPSRSREFFLYGLLFITLYIAAFSLGGLLFQLINLYLPDPAAREYAYGMQHARDLLRGFASALIVSGPVFFWLIMKLRREQRASVGLAVSPLRKWLTHLTLLVASVVAIADVTGIVNGFLGGELASRAFAKMISVLVIAGAGLVYFLSDVRDKKS